MRNGLIHRRFACINNAQILGADRRFHGTLAGAPTIIPVSAIWASNHSNQRKLSMPPKRKQSQIIPPEGNEAAAAIYAVIRRIPRGWIATYGQVAAMAGLPKRARLVGQVLQHLGPATDIPWHRVVNAKGEVSYALSRNGGDALQQRLLEKEGVEFDNRNRFDLERFRWPE
jgi:methylated-DNA-protein-cysteine methyltransferase related protein